MQYNIGRKLTMKFRNRFSRGIKRFEISGKDQLSKYGISIKAIFDKIGQRPSINHQLDHIIPISWFDMNVPQHFVICHLPENLQWLKQSDNSAKSNDIKKDIFLDSKKFTIMDSAIYFRKRYDGEIEYDQWFENWYESILYKPKRA